MIVVGVDGCKAGWVAAAWDTRKESMALSTHGNFEELMDAFPSAKAIAVDIPIGLIECRRACDVEARAVLRCRKSSVFPAPDPRVACMTDYWEANGGSWKDCGKGVSRQAFGIFPKVCEVNRLMTPELQDRIVEVHPELCFWAMKGYEEVCPPKRSGEGYLERRALLQANLALSEEAWATVDLGIRGAQPDDVLDALAASWTARRWVNGLFGRFPEVEEKDGRGLRAEIVY